MSVVKLVRIGRDRYDVYLDGVAVHGVLDAKVDVSNPTDGLSISMRVRVSSLFVEDPFYEKELADLGLTPADFK